MPCPLASDREGVASRLGNVTITSRGFYDGKTETLAVYLDRIQTAGAGIIAVITVNSEQSDASF